MPLFGGFRIGRWFGFPIRIDYSWFVVAALVVWTFSFSEFPLRLPGRGQGTYLAMGVAAALLFFLSVLLHELSHAVVARWRGITVEGITLFIFGGIAQAREEAKRPIDEFLLTAAGPLASLGLAGVFWAVERGADAVSAPAPLGVVVGFLALLNLVLAVFNMIPGFPLDGGRIFRSIVWAVTGDMDRATRWATWGGRLFGGALIVLGVFGLMSGLVLGGLWAVFIGWFLANAASTSYRQFRLRRVLESIPVSRVMSVDTPAIPADMAVDRVISEYFLRSSSEVHPVEMDGIVLGLVSVADVGAVPHEMRAATTAANVMRPTYDLPTARPDETLAEVAIRLGGGDGPTALVLAEGGLVGLVDVANLGRWAARVERLGVDLGEAGLGRESGGHGPGSDDRDRGDDPGRDPDDPGPDSDGPGPDSAEARPDSDEPGRNSDDGDRGRPVAAGADTTAD